MSAASPPSGNTSDETCGRACASPVSTVVTLNDGCHVHPPSGERMTLLPSEASTQVPSGRPAAWVTMCDMPGGALMTNHDAGLFSTASVAPGHGFSGPRGEGGPGIPGKAVPPGAAAPP